jgi:hypothetical protein
MFQQAGPAQFSALIGQVAPYFASIAPQMVELRPGYAEVTFPKRREVLTISARCTPSPCATPPSWRPAA